MQETIELRCPTGEINLNQITLGGKGEVLIVPTGIYSVRITGWGRDQAGPALAEAEKRYADDEDGLEDAQQLLCGTEHYLIQFLLKEATAGITHDDGCYVPEGADRIALIGGTGADQAVFPTDVTSVSAHSLGFVVAVDPRRRAVMRFVLWDGPAPELPASLSLIADGLTVEVPEGRTPGEGELCIYGLRSGRTTYQNIPSGHENVPAGRYMVRLSASDASEEAVYQADLWPERG